MYWTNICLPTVRVQYNIFEQTLTEVDSLYLYASFGTFCVQIGQLFESQWASEECLNIDKSLFSKEMSPISGFFRMFKTHCASNTWPIWTQKLSKEAWRCKLPIYMRVFLKTFWCKRIVGRQKFGQYICMLYLGFIDVNRTVADGSFSSYFKDCKFYF